MYFYNEKLGWMVGESSPDAGHISKTTDGGSTWVDSDYKFFPPLNGITFIDSLKGFAVVALGGGGLFQTTDGGENWQLYPKTVFGFDVGFLDDKNGWVSSGGQILKTTDGGEIWGNQFDNDINYLLVKLIVLKKDKIAYVLGLNPYSSTATLLRADLSIITDVKKDVKGMLPLKSYLDQNYPNPFNPRAIISYNLAVSGHVSLKVYDILGREVATLVNEKQNAGVHLATFDGTRCASGVYFYTLTTPDFNQVKKMVLMK